MFSHSQVSKEYLRGGWKKVERTEELNAVDLQLPTQNVSQIMLDFKQQQQQTKDNEEKVKKEEEGESEIKGEENPPAAPTSVLREKTVADLKRPLGPKDAPVSFKKRTAVKRSIRSREEAADQ